MGSFIFLAIVSAVIALVVLSRGEIQKFESSSGTRQILMAVTAQLSGKRRWSSVTHSAESAVFAYHRKPKWFIALPLLLCFVAPGIVYLMLAGKTESVTVMVDESGVLRTVQVASNGWRGKSAGRSIRQQFAVAQAAPTDAVVI